MVSLSKLFSSQCTALPMLFTYLLTKTNSKIILDFFLWLVLAHKRGTYVLCSLNTQFIWFLSPKIGLYVGNWDAVALPIVYQTTNA
jgi:hypothetical protein